MASSEKITAESTIGQYLPQSPPMVMVGKLLLAEEKKTITSLVIREDNIFCSEGCFREPGLIENMAQSAAAGTGYRSRKEGKDPPVGYIGGIRDIRILDLPRIGEEITTEVTVIHEVFDALVVSGKVFLDNRCIASCELKIFLSKPK